MILRLVGLGTRVPRAPRLPWLRWETCLGSWFVLSCGKCALLCLVSVYNARVGSRGSERGVRR